MLMMENLGEALWILTYDISCIISQGVRVHPVLVAKYMHQLVKVFALLLLSSGNMRQNFRTCQTEADIFYIYYTFTIPTLALTFCLRGSVWNWPSAFLSWSDTVQVYAGSPGWPWPERSGWRYVCFWCCPSSCSGCLRSPKRPGGPQSHGRSRQA